MGHDDNSSHDEGVDSPEIHSAPASAKGHKIGACCMWLDRPTKESEMGVSRKPDVRSDHCMHAWDEAGLFVAQHWSKCMRTRGCAAVATQRCLRQVPYGEAVCPLLLSKFYDIDSFQVRCQVAATEAHPNSDAPQ